jgi:two-component system response regulator
MKDMMNMISKKNIIVLLADDDHDDRYLIQEAITETDLPINLLYVKDGQELLDYLKGEGEYRDGRTAPKPGLILLDLNMPRMDGREALKEIKADPSINNIPVIVMTTSSAEEDIQYCYEFGVASYITKPLTFSGLVETMTVLGEYWLKIATLPRS